MKPKILLTAVLSTCAAIFLTLSPGDSRAAETPEAPALAAALLDLQAQQAAILQNQAKIDEQVAVIKEELRLARIFVSRGGQK